jgi:diguanylate cyclase (GGDEF)-like protein/PAS domain S-box-containing protein
VQMRISRKKENEFLALAGGEMLGDLPQHKVALEQQRIELTQTKDALERLLSRYLSLYEFAPIGYFTLNENGLVNEVNLVGSRLLGQEYLKLIKQNFIRFIVPKDSEIWHIFFHNLIHGDVNKSCEVRMRRSDGSMFCALLECSIQHFSSRHFESKETKIKSVTSKQEMTSEGVTVLVAISDITKIKNTEQQLNIAAKVFNSQEGMMVTDANSVILKVNAAFTNITGYSEEDVVGKTPKVLSSGRYDQEFYRDMWMRINDFNEWEGEIWNRRKNGEIFPEWLTIAAVKADSGEVTNYVATLTDITKRKASESEMNFLAFYDPLTHLPNRRLFNDRFKRAMSISARNKTYCALMFLDLDKFKLVNDNLGHDMGDLMLQIIAQKLTLSIRECDTVSRSGGDEFMVMLENLNENLEEATLQVEIIAKKILETISEPIQMAGHKCASTVSIGITLFINHVFSLSEIQKQADIAMYQAKKEGRNRLKFFTSTSIPHT